MSGDAARLAEESATATPTIEGEVLRRYAGAADQAEAALCCAVDGYDKSLLEKLPQEIIEKDYGCGDPSQWVGPGDVALDLGSGSGKICYVLSQKVGCEGKVIGVDFNDAMLELSRKYQDEMAARIGYGNVRFVKAKIQDMGLDLDRAGAWLKTHPVTGIERLAAFEAECDRLRDEDPGVADESVDVVVSNCVLNLVKAADKKRLFLEIHRVLRRGGRAVISDIVCDEDPTEAILSDPKLWSGCISGAFREDRFLEAFEEAGFYGVEIVSRAAAPWQVLDGIEFRSLTVRAFKGKEGPCLERNQAVVYRGPFKKALDDDGHSYHRGRRIAVCDKTFRLLTDAAGPYAGRFEAIEPNTEVPLDGAMPFDCNNTTARDPRVTKGQHYSETRLIDGDACCGDGACC
ncbi:MAG: methyltransferase domain-containing protein [Planctomycetes bacterium]|nr:methyltransferase domain-containing protein [Planctomycetota bacterium]